MPLRLGLIGCGDYSQHHLDAIESDSDFELAGVVDPDPERGAQVVKRFSCRRYSALEALAADDGVDAVIIASPNRYHFQQFKACADRCKHVYVNIPATIDPAEARQMVQLSRERGIVYQIGDNFRSNLAFIEFKNRLLSGEIGAVHLIDAVAGCPRGYTLTPGEWRASRQESPLLPFTQFGIVLMEVILHVWGPPQTVFAYLTKRDGAGDAPDLGVAVARYSDGRAAHVGCAYVMSYTHVLRAYGRDGALTWDQYDDNTVALHRNGQTTSRPRASAPTIGQQHAELLEFASCIREHRQPDAGGIDAYHLAEYFRCIARSAQTGAAAAFHPWHQTESSVRSNHNAPRSLRECDDDQHVKART